MTNQRIDQITELPSVEVHKAVQLSATELAANVAQNLNDTAAMLEKISPVQYGLLITSLRWHASRTASNDFIGAYQDWILDNLQNRA